MEKNQIKVVIEGMPQDNGLVRIDAFINGLNSITKAVGRTDRIVSGKSTASFYLRITELSYKSPATVTMEAVPQDPDVDLRNQVISKFYDVYESIQKGALAEKEIESVLIEDMTEITNQIGNRINSINITMDEYDLTLTKEFKAKIDLAIAPEEKSSSFIRGMLEYINIHKNKNVFRIYPDIGPRKIICHFPEELREKAIEAIGQYVEVKGELKFRAVSKHPHEILVEEIEIFPPEEELPTLYELRGIAPDLTGELSSEQFVRKIRNAQIS